MKKIYLLIVLFCSTILVNAQLLVADSLIETKTKSALEDEGFFFARYGVNTFHLTYNTKNPDGSPTIATGVVILPWTSGCSMPIGVYCHGTIAQDDNAPSRNPTGERRIGHAIASDGYMAVIPDYLGLGYGPGPHPYVHGASEASATLDMIRAAREFCANKGYQLNGEVFITGYSQGGHAAAATVRAIDDSLSSEFNVLAWAGGSGPYDVSGVQEAVLRDTVPYSDPGYLPFIATSYQYVYGNIYDSLSEAFIAPYDSIIDATFTGAYDISAINPMMDSIPRRMIDSAYFQDYISDPNHPLKQALRDNDLYAWAPSMPTRLYYCPMDEKVTYLNSFVARDSMIARGATDVQAILADPAALHTDCAFPALIAAKTFFDGFANRCFTTGIETQEYVKQFQIYPNPSDGDIYLPLQDWEETTVRIYTLSGQMLLETTLDGGDERQLSLQNLPGGSYLIDLQSSNKRTTQSLVILQ